MQAVNLSLPVLTIPYIILIYDIETYGLIAFATALCMFFCVICDYGFNLTATNEISRRLQKSESIDEIVSTTLACKSILFVVCSFIYFSIVMYIPRYHEELYVFGTTFGIVLAATLNPIWLFHGKKKLKTYSAINISLKTIITCSIFFSIGPTIEPFYVTLILASAQVVPAVVCLAYAIYIFDIRLRITTRDQIASRFLGAWHIFMSKIAVFSYGTLNLVVLEFFTGVTIVAYYSIASRVIGAANSILGTINQALFPRMARKWIVSRQDFFDEFAKTRKYLACLLITFSLLIFLTSEYIIRFLDGVGNYDSIIVLRILCFALILYPFGGLYTQCFIVQDRKAIVLKVTILTTIVNAVLVSMLIPLFGVYGLATSVCLVQLFQLGLNSKHYTADMPLHKYRGS